MIAILCWVSDVSMVVKEQDYQLESRDVVAYGRKGCGGCVCC